MLKHPLNINSNINYENQDCKIRRVWEGEWCTSGRERGKEGD
jgi:hypothetical protein